MIPCAKSYIAAKVQYDFWRGKVYMNFGIDCNGIARAINSIGQVQFISYTLGSLQFGVSIANFCVMMKVICMGQIL